MGAKENREWGQKKKKRERQNSTVQETLKLDATRRLLNIGKCADKNKRNMKGTTRKLPIGNKTEMIKYLNRVLKKQSQKCHRNTKKAVGAYAVPGEDTLRELANKHYPSI